MTRCPRRFSAELVIALATAACGPAPPGSPAAVDLPTPSARSIPRDPSPVARAPRERPRPSNPVAWRTDADAATRESDRTGKPLLVYLRASWCVACLELERGFGEDASFERASRSFVPLWLDATDDAVLSEVSARFGVLAVPSIALIDRATGRRAVLDTRALLDRPTDSVLAFVSEGSP